MMEMLPSKSDSCLIVLKASRPIHKNNIFECNALITSF